MSLPMRVSAVRYLNARPLYEPLLGKDGVAVDLALRQVKGKCGALIIGDVALDIEHRFPHVLDLGSAWLEWTGLPFVFAAWGGRAGALPPGGEQVLLAAKAEGMLQRDAIADLH